MQRRPWEVARLTPPSPAPPALPRAAVAFHVLFRKDQGNEVGGAAAALVPPLLTSVLSRVCCGRRRRPSAAVAAAAAATHAHTRPPTHPSTHPDPSTRPLAHPPQQEFSTISNAFLTMWANQSDLLDLNLMRASHNPVRCRCRRPPPRHPARCSAAASDAAAGVRGYSSQRKKVRGAVLPA